MQAAPFSAFDWYWRAGDGRLYASSRQVIVGADDPAFLRWCENGNVPTAWPRDAAGAQTNAALQEVLNPYGLFSGLEGYAAAKRYAVEVGGVRIEGVHFATDDRSKTMLLGARIAAAADPAFKTPWAGSDGIVRVLDAATIVAVSDAVLAHVAACFACYANVVADIAAERITARSEIDEAFAAVTA